jgi:hypothetical protein
LSAANSQEIVQVTVFIATLGGGLFAAAFFSERTFNPTSDLALGFSIGLVRAVQNLPNIACRSSEAAAGLRQSLILN